MSSGRGGELRQAPPHLLGRALEHPPATQREQGVAHEHRMVRRVVIADVAERMAAGVDHPEQGLAELHRVALMQRAVQGRDAGHLAGPDDLSARRRLHRRVAARMVGVPVGVHDQAEGPAGGLQRRQHGVGVRRVDGGGQARGLVPHQIAVVVGQAGELVYGDGHGRRPLV